MANKIKLGRATKTRIENIKTTLDDYELVYATDTDEIGVKKPDGEVNYIGAGGGADLDALPYMNYAANIYYQGGSQTLFPSAWQDMKEVDGAEIERVSTTSTQYGMLQYPNGEDNGVIIPDSVTSIGNSAFYGWSANNQPLVIPNSVTSIGNYAFWNWSSNNQPLVIPNSVTSIGSYAFYNWEANNQPLVIPDSVTSIGNYAFRNWTTNNQPLVIPNSVTSISDGAFWNWSSNNQPLVIPNSVTGIGNSAFNGWSNVPYVEIQATTPPTLVNANAFSGQNDALIYVPHESVEAYKTATNWSALASRIFPISDKADLMDDIADLQENKQDKLVAGDNITIEDNVISASGGGGIPEAPIDNKLYGRKNAAWSEIISGGGSGVDLDALPYMNYAADIYYRVGRQSLFSNAWEHSLTVDPSEIERVSTTSTQYGKLQYPNGEVNGVIIPDSVTSIGNYAFRNWTTNNQPLVIPNSVTSIGGAAFWNWSSNNQPLVIPNSVTSIGGGAFYNWEANNQPLVIPNSVTSISEYAFSYWEANNQPLVIPNSVTNIGEDAFSTWKTNNQPLVIPNSVTSIGSYAFYNWQAVPYIIVERETPPTIASSNSFGFQNDAPIYVPHNSVDDYKEATNWVDLADRIFSINDKEGVIGDIKSALDTILGV